MHFCCVWSNSQASNSTVQRNDGSYWAMAREVGSSSVPLQSPADTTGSMSCDVFSVLPSSDHSAASLQSS